MGEQRQPEGGGAGRALAFRLLGGFAVAIDGREVAATWRTEKARALVKLLALAPGHALARDEIFDLLWPEREPEAAANNLYFALHAARRVLDAGLGPRETCLINRQGRLRLAPPGGVTTDVLTFEAAARAAAASGSIALHEAALASYGGDLLPEDRYEDWATGRREALRGARRALLERLAGLHAGRGAWEAAIDLLERLLAEDALHEEATAALMRALAASGQRGRALRRYATLRDNLRRELGVEPDAAVQALYATILAGPTPPPAAAPPAPPRQERGHLPLPLSRFIGRERELAQIRALLAPGPGPAARAPRLLTLTGPGGGGKSRLALEAAHGLPATFPGGIWLVELSALREPALVPGAIARTLGVVEDAGEARDRGLLAALREGATLLILDNCEHLLDACAAVAARLLALVPGLRILATSREALQVPGELVRPVGALGLPPGPGDARWWGEGWREALLASEAAQLLLDRIALRRPDFAPAAADAAPLAAICRRLDGLPLALELAAARVATLGSAPVAARLDRALDLLAGGQRATLPHQQTLRASIAWSYQLLTPAEADLLDRLAVFAGGWEVAAAEALGGAPADRGTLHLLALLVEKSLVLIEAGEGRVRYRLLEVVREYALARLEERGLAGATRDAHADHYVATLAGAHDGFLGPGRSHWRALLEAEEENARAALAHLAARADAEAGLRLCWALWRFWSDNGQGDEARAWFDRFLALGGSPEWRARGLFAAGMIGVQLGDNPAAGRALRACLALAIEHGFRRWQAAALAQLGHIARRAGDPHAAVAHSAEALELRRRFGDQREIAISLMGLGTALGDAGDPARAEALLSEARASFHALGDRGEEASALYHLAWIACLRGDGPAARAHLTASLDHWWRLDARGRIANWLTPLARACAEGAPAEALRLLGALRALTARASATEQTTLIAQLRARLDPAAATAAWEAGTGTGAAGITALAAAMLGRQARYHAERAPAR